MPLLNRNAGPAPVAGAPLYLPPAAADRQLAPEPALRAGLFESCANLGCGSGRLKLWPGRRTALFEGRWSCSPGCTRARIEAALSREMRLRSSAPEVHRPRIPLGLTMLEQGWITASQLRKALEAQRAAGAGRLGQWLVRQRAASEELVTRALGLQWSCPVLGVDFHDAETVSGLLPRLFVDAHGALPLHVAAGKILYVAFEDRPDPVLALAVERMTGLRVESGLVQESVFRSAHSRMLAACYPRTTLLEASSETSLGDTLLEAIDKTRAADARLVRVHDCLWLRMWLQPRTSYASGRGPVRNSVVDVICSLSVQ